MLPGLDGIEVCRRIQADRAVPVLMLTARDSETDLVAGLEVGADDYMTKPFSARELVAQCTRSSRVARVAAASRADAIGDGRARSLDAPVRPHGEPLHLTPTEFDLLHVPCGAPGRVSTREELLEQVWGYEALRRAYGRLPCASPAPQARRRPIRTVHAVGYAVEDEAAFVTGVPQ